MGEIIKYSLISVVSIFIFWKFFIWQFWVIFRDDINLRTAKKDLPILANELKLNHKKSDLFGTYIGHWNKHKIRIEPNNYQTAISIKTTVNPQFSANHTGISEKYDLIYLFHFLTKIVIKFIPDYPVGEGKKSEFSFEDALLDKYFQDRRILGEKGKDNIKNQELQKVLKTFLNKNSKKVQNFFISSEVSCSLWVGSSSTKTRNYSVTSKQVKEMLSEMLPIVEKLDQM